MKISWNFIKKRKTVLLWALALPPRYKDHQWENFQRLEKLFSLKKSENQAKVDFLTKDATALHGMAALNKKQRELNYLSADASTLFVWDLSKKKLKERSSKKALSFLSTFNMGDSWEWSFPRGSYRLTAKGELTFFSNKAGKKNTWKEQIDTSLLSYSSRPSKEEDFLSWKLGPNRFYKMNWGTGRQSKQSVLHRVKWNSKSKLNYMQYCRKDQFVLVEELKRNLFRFVWFKDLTLSGMRPELYQEVDFSAYVKDKEAIQFSFLALEDNCKRFWALGSHGIAEIQF